LLDETNRDNWESEEKPKNEVAEIPSGTHPLASSPTPTHAEPLPLLVPPPKPPLLDDNNPLEEL